jgi:hypothetical protein
LSLDWGSREKSRRRLAIGAQVNNLPHLGQCYFRDCSEPAFSRMEFRDGRGQV